MTYYTLYKITNTVNNKYYIGVHETDNLNDGYLGSGTLIQAAVKKYGKDSFVKEYLQFFNSSEEMYDAEKQFITEDLIESNDCYNVSYGGTGGSIKQNRKSFSGPHSPESIEKIKSKRKLQVMTEETKQKISAANRRTNASRGAKVSTALTGRTKSEEHKRKIAESLKARHALKKIS